MPDRSRCGTTSCAPTTRPRPPRCSALVRRLQRMDVVVRRLTAPLTVPDYTPYAGAPASTTLPVGHLLDPDGPGAEALGAGDAQRGHLRPVPVLLRRDRLEPAAAVQRRRRPVRRGADAGRDGGAAVGGAGRAAAPGGRAGRRRSGRCPTAPTRSSPAAGCAGCWTSAGDCRTTTSPPAEIATGALAAADVLVVPDGDAAAGRRRWARRACRRCAAGSRRAAAWSDSAAAPPWPARLGVTGATLASPASDIPGSLVRASVAGPGRSPPASAARCGTSSSTTRCCTPLTRPTVAVVLPSRADLRALRLRRGGDELARHRRGHRRAVLRRPGRAVRLRPELPGVHRRHPEDPAQRRPRARIPATAATVDRRRRAPRRPRRPSRWPTSAATCS